MDFKAETITKATEFFRWSGNKVDGAYKTSDPDMLFIEKSALIRLLEAKQEREQLKKRETAHIQEIMSGKVQSTNITDADYAKYFSAKSVEIRQKKKREADALIVAYSILGYNTFSIQEEVSQRGFHCSASKISRAISVKDTKDRGRIQDLMKDYPDYFLNVSDTLFERWYSKRLEKCHKKSEWGE